MGSMMRRNAVIPAVVIFLVIFAIILAGFAAMRLRGGGNATEMIGRLLREDATSGVQVYPGTLPPVLDQILNVGVTDLADRMSVPIPAGARLVGSSHLRQSDGTDLVWLMYDVDGALNDVSGIVAEQLDTSPWQITAGRGEGTAQIMRFQNRRLVDLEGSVRIRIIPGVDRYRLVVSRDGTETALDIQLIALTPTVGAKVESDLTVSRVWPGPALEAGLRAGDRILRVGDSAVSGSSELAAALQQVAQSGTRASLTYILAAPSDPDAGDPPFAPPQRKVSLPADFPAPDAWRDLTVLDYQWAVRPGVKTYQASMLSTGTAAEVAASLRVGLEGADWEIAADRPQGFATQLGISHQADGLIGQVLIDQFPSDSAYLQVLVQIQTAPLAGTP